MRAPCLLVLAAVLAAPATAQTPDTRAIDKEIERLRGELVALGAAEQKGEGAAIGERARLVALNQQEAALRAKIGANRDALSKLLAALQTYQRRPPPALLVNPRSAKDAVRAAILIRAIAPELQARGRAFARQADEIARLRRTAAAASESLFRAESDIADRRARIDRLLVEKNALERKLYADSGAPDPATRALAARTGSVEAFVDALATSPTSEAPATAPERLTSPVQGVLVRRFGEPTPGRERSQGWTWRTQAEAAVVAPAAARVDYAGPLKGWDEVLILAIGGGRHLVLAGLANVSVGVGRMVAAGEPVGRLGPGDAQAGAAPELYLEVRGPGGAMDPGRWLAAAQNPVTGVRR